LSLSLFPGPIDYAVPVPVLLLINIHIYTITAESIGEIIIKIGQYLAKLWARVGCPVFLTHGVMPLKSNEIRLLGPLPRRNMNMQ